MLDGAARLGRCTFRSRGIFHRIRCCGFGSGCALRRVGCDAFGCGARALGAHDFSFGACSFRATWWFWHAAHADAEVAGPVGHEHGSHPGELLDGLALGHASGHAAGTFQEVLEQRASGTSGLDQAEDAVAGRDANSAFGGIGHPFGERRMLGSQLPQAGGPFVGEFGDRRQLRQQGVEEGGLSALDSGDRFLPCHLGTGFARGDHLRKAGLLVEVSIHRMETFRARLIRFQQQRKHLHARLLKASCQELVALLFVEMVIVDVGMQLVDHREQADELVLLVVEVQSVLFEMFGAALASTEGIRHGCTEVAAANLAKGGNRLEGNRRIAHAGVAEMRDGTEVLHVVEELRGIP